MRYTMPLNDIYSQRLTRSNTYHISRHRLTNLGAVFFRLNYILYVEIESTISPLDSFAIYLN